jgi:TATA-binding protein-associated factor
MLRFSRLSDADDDVRSVAAQCLIPIAHILVERLEADLPRVLAVLWGSLEFISDDLGSSVGAVMELLGKLVAFSQVTDLLADESKSYVRSAFHFNIC